MDLRANRNKLQISQSRLASLAGVSRFKICLYELNEGTLTSQELRLIHYAFHAEAKRLRSVADAVDLDQAELPPAGIGVLA